MDATAEKFRFGDIVGYKPEKRKECFEYLNGLGYGFEEVSNETVIITSVLEREVCGISQRTVNTMLDCNKCIWSTRDGQCVSWECDFVSHEDARKMIVEKEEGCENHDD